MFEKEAIAVVSLYSLFMHSLGTQKWIKTSPVSLQECRQLCSVADGRVNSLIFVCQGTGHSSAQLSAESMI